MIFNTARLVLIVNAKALLTADQDYKGYINKKWHACQIHARQVQMKRKSLLVTYSSNTQQR